MARAGIVFGLILCGVTLVGLIVTPAKTPTQFFPMILGIPVLFCGVVALNPHRRRSSMLCALIMALAGALIGSVWSIVQLMTLAQTNGGTDLERYSLRLIASMTLVCTLFVGFCALGFYRLRRRSSRRIVQPVTTVRLPSHADSITQDSDLSSSREIA